jgi:hypothetical protein
MPFATLYHISLRRILILSSHLLLGLPSGHLLPAIQTKTLSAFLIFPHACFLLNPSPPSTFNQPIKIWEENKLRRPSLRSFLQPHAISSLLGPTTDTNTLCRTLCCVSRNKDFAFTNVSAIIRKSVLLFVKNIGFMKPVRGLFVGSQ